MHVLHLKVHYNQPEYLVLAAARLFEASLDHLDRYRAIVGLLDTDILLCAILTVVLLAVDV